MKKFAIFLFCLFFATASSIPAQAAQSGVEALLAGARAEVSRSPLYKSGYHRGGYPPVTEGVCTDLVWRAFRDAGVELKDLMDADIKANPSAYPRVGGKPDRNIDFRRVPNQSAYFKRHAQVLPTRLDFSDPKSFADWLPGDIVVFRNPDHIAILSDRKSGDGVPLLLHNDGPWPCEADDLKRWYERGIVARYRWNFE